jgi:DNA-binding transcriptional LysR family regulator
MDSFAGMEAFARVVETGSFTAAAARLQTAKSSVSDLVRGLEERLGVRLLERTTRRVRPTEAGQLFYARCRRILDEAGVARAEARTFQSAPTGRLRVAVPESFAERYIVPSLAEFLAKFPSVAIDLVSAAHHVRLVEDEFDLAIRIVEMPAPGLVVRRIGTSRIFIVAAPSYLAAHGMPRVPQDLTHHQCVGIATPLPWHGAWRVGQDAVAVRHALLVNSTESLRAAAIAGLGFALLPDWLAADALAAGQLMRVLADFETPSSGIYAVYPTNRLLTPLIRLFVQHVISGLRSRGVPE